MDTISSVFAVAGAITLGAISPGPSFVMVARTAVASSRANAMAASFGMGVGALMFAVAAIIGLQALLAAVPWLYLSIKIIGGIYLAYIGYRIWCGAAQPLNIHQVELVTSNNRLIRSFLLGLATQVSNPKTAIIYTSVFAALLPPVISWKLAMIIPALVFFIETGWYSVVAVVLSSETPRAAYLHSKRMIDRTAGGVMALLGIKLVTTNH